MSHAIAFVLGFTAAVCSLTLAFSVREIVMLFS
jgi:hypothetical protein